MRNLVKLFAVFVIFSLMSKVDSNEYCSISHAHTMCLFTGFGSDCEGVSLRGVSQHDMQVILHEHNKLRSRIANGLEGKGGPGPQPAAANMETIEWDSELSAVAQKWADQCNFNHDSNRDVRRFEVGQNLYQIISLQPQTKANWAKAIKSWTDEVSIFNPDYIQPYGFSEAWGHYTQIAWATTNRVGCGVIQYKNGDFHHATYVCNYGPSGNWSSGSMYVEGRACSRCPGGKTCSRTYPGLCG